MNPITPWLVCVALLLMLIFAVYVAIKTFKTQKQEIKRLTSELERQKQNVAYLARHAEEVAKIERDKDKTNEDIANAKTDEEIVDIVNTIVSANNNRVRK